jgi:hypothetical protein
MPAIHLHECEPFDLGIEPGDPCVKVVTVPSLRATLEVLHVLLRHRPRSIARHRGEGRSHRSRHLKIAEWLAVKKNPRKPYGKGQGARPGRVVEVWRGETDRFLRCPAFTVRPPDAPLTRATGAVFCNSTLRRSPSSAAQKRHEHTYASPGREDWIELRPPSDKVATMTMGRAA